MAEVQQLPARGTREVTTPVKQEIERSAELSAGYEKQRAMAEIEGKVILAQRFPRDEERAAVETKKLCLRPDFAETGYYDYPRAGRPVQGPSVWLARAMAALWGNITYGKRVLRDDGETISIEGFAWDLQYNTSVTEQAEFANLIFRRKGGWQKPDERDKRELINKHGAIAERNCLLKLLPRDVVEDAFQTCKKTVSSKPEDKQKRLRGLLASFGEHGITRDMLEQWLANRREDESAPLESLNNDEYADLRGVYNSICEGHTRANEHFKFQQGPGNGAATEEVKPPEMVATAFAKPESQPATTAEASGPEDEPPAQTGPGEQTWRPKKKFAKPESESPPAVDLGPENESTPAGEQTGMKLDPLGTKPNNKDRTWYRSEIVNIATKLAGSWEAALYLLREIAPPDLEVVANGDLAPMKMPDLKALHRMLRTREKVAK